MIPRVVYQRIRSRNHPVAFADVVRGYKTRDWSSDHNNSASFFEVLDHVLV